MRRMYFLSGPQQSVPAAQLLTVAQDNGLTNLDLLEIMEGAGYDVTPLVEAMVPVDQLAGWWSKIKDAAGKTSRALFEAAGLSTIGNAVVSVSDKMVRAMESVLGQEVQQRTDAWAKRFIDALPFNTRVKAGLYASWPVLTAAGVLLLLFFMWRRAK